MGAVTAIHSLRYDVLRDEVAPALRRLVAGSGSDRVPAWLAEAIAADLERTARGERQFPEHYETHRRYSDDLRALADGVGVAMFGDCDQLRSDLGVRDRRDLLLATVPRMEGACLSTSCEGRAACPLHPEGQSPVRAEVLMRHIRGAFAARCLGTPRWITRWARWGNLRAWYQMELGSDWPEWPESRWNAHLDRDPMLRLLVRLLKRGAAVGWDDGGSGEGLLGWLDPAETAQIVDGLDAYDLSPDAPIPEELRAEDGYAANEYLPQMRGIVADMREAAAEAAASGLGVALTRR